MARKKPKNQSTNKGGKPFHKGKKGRSANTNRADKVSPNDERYDERPERGSSNAPEWWMSVGPLAIQATNISTFNAAGAPESSPVFQWTDWTPAGIMRLDYVPYFGDVRDVTHPINVAAKQIYDWVNSKNSRNLSYDPVDIFMYVIAVANAWSFHSFVRRICGMYGTFSSTNRYWWRPVLESMGIAPIDTDNDITAWRNLANRMAIQLNRLPVPNDIAYFNRAIMMNEAIYMDSPTQKASLYYFCPGAFMQYTVGDSEAGMGLKNHTCPWYDLENLNNGQPVTPAVAENYFNRMVTALFNDTDINTIGSDIIKAYGLENCFKLPQIDESYAILPIYDPVVNLQVHNARVSYNMGNHLIDNPYELVQDMTYNGIRSKYSLNTDYSSPDHALVATDKKAGRQIALDYPVDNPDNNMVMESTRLTWYATEDSVSHVTYINACVDILVKDRCFTFTRQSSTRDWAVTEVDKCLYVGFADTDERDDFTSNISKLAMSSKFACAPITYAMYMEGVHTYNSPDYMDITCDVTNFTTVSTETLRRINEAAIYSIFMPLKMRS